MGGSPREITFVHVLLSKRKIKKNVSLTDCPSEFTCAPKAKLTTSKNSNNYVTHE